MSNNKEITLNDLNVGDWVFERSRFSATLLYKIERVTPKTAVVDRASYWLKNGNMVGSSSGSWSSRSIIWAPQPGEVGKFKAGLRKATIIKQIRSAVLEELSEEALKNIYDKLAAVMPKDDPDE